LDIDNACWDELRYDFDVDEDAPEWMVNPLMRQAIRAVQILDRCHEEDARLAHEERNIVSWFGQEWEAVRRAIRSSLMLPALVHQLVGRRKSLLILAVRWRKHLPPLPGPTEADMAKAIREWEMASCDVVQPQSAVQNVMEDEEGPGVGGDSDAEALEMPSFTTSDSSEGSQDGADKSADISFDSSPL
ncbi:hypothetical protein EV715DRAFT_215214, partial [Schizophyllum commune]